MSIQNGQIQTTQTNTYGFTSYKIGGKWYGSDAKGGPKGSEGDAIQFEAFNKQDKNNPDKFYPTIKVATIVKVSGGGQAPAGATGAVASTGSSGGYKSTGPGTGRDTYWADKAKSDSEKDPRIAYFASSERAIQFVDLAIRNGAFKALEKAKDTSKLEILESFVNEQTIRIMAASYAATVPSVPQTKEAPADVQEPTGASDESWS